MATPSSLYDENVLFGGDEEEGGAGLFGDSYIPPATLDALDTESASPSSPTTNDWDSTRPGGSAQITDAEMNDRLARAKDYYTQLVDYAESVGNSPSSYAGYDEDLLRHAKYDVEDLEATYQSLRQQIERGASNVPGDENGDGTDDRGDSGGGGGGGSSSSVDTRRPTSAGDGGAAVTAEQMQQLLAALSTITGQQTNAINGIPSPPDIPVIEVPGENLSPDIDAALRSLLSDQPSSLETTIADRLGALLGPDDDTVLNERIGSARDRMAMLEQALVEDMRGNLASRGLASLPGTPQGEEVGGMRRISESVAREFAPEFSNIVSSEYERRDARTLDTLTLATGYNRDQAAQLLAAATTAGQRQEFLADTALKTLEQNRLWSQFLAQFNLDRESLLWDIRNGQAQNVLMLVQQFLSLVQQSRGGYI